VYMYVYVIKSIVQKVLVLVLAILFYEVLVLVSAILFETSIGIGIAGTAVTTHFKKSSTGNNVFIVSVIV